MVKNVCIIEDEEDIANVISDILKDSGFNTEVYLDGEDFLKQYDSEKKSIYLVDWHLPGAPGLEIIKTIRLHDKVSPIFMVSAYSKKDEVITCLKAGADDYLTKPFNSEELLMRVENAWAKFELMLREKNRAMAAFVLIPEATSFIKDGKTIQLTDREYTIFEYLYQHKNESVKRDALIGLFKNDEMTSRNIDVHVFSIRKKIKECNFVINTVWGTGYTLKD